MGDSEFPPKRNLLATAFSWFVIAAIVAFILIRNTTYYRAAADRPLTAAVPQPDLSLEITGRMLLGQTDLVSHLSGANPALQSGQRARMLAAIDAAAVTPADKLNAVPVIAELAGCDSAIARLDQLIPRLTANPLLAADASVLRNLYMHGAKSITPPQRGGLIDRHAWFGQLALVFGLPSNNPQRQSILHAAVQTTIVLWLLFILLLIALAAGIVLFIIAIVMLKKRRLRFSFQPTLPLGPPAYLETFALWLTIWVAISFLLRFLGVQLSTFSTEIAGALFSLAIAFWPLCRGIKWSQLRRDLGWHRGRGPLREIAAGLLGYLAGLPLAALGFAITAILIKTSAAHPTHPVLRELGNASPLSLVGIYLAACLFAPLIEETMFRGALYNHLRSRRRPLLSALVVSFIFAAIHPQGWPVIPLLGSIALILATLRESRSSLLASMTAHALNNAIGVTTVVLLLR